MKPNLLILAFSVLCVSLPVSTQAKVLNNLITIGFAGDCTFGTVNGDDSTIRFPTVYKRSGNKIFPFALVKSDLEKDDFNVVNFECTLTKRTQMANKQWHFKGDASYAKLFAAANIGAVTLANNHSFDYLQAGFDDTIKNFAQANEPVFYQNTPFITNVKGVKLVLIGDCTVIGENTTNIDGTPRRVLEEIKRYKTPNDLVIVFMHWGSELDTAPRSWQQAMGHLFIDSGADAVVGCHPHVLQGVELYKGKYIAYSLGNFAFGGNSLARNPETVILKLKFRVNNNVPVTDSASIVPCFITSTDNKYKNALINNYQPNPLPRSAAIEVTRLLLERCAVLPFGVSSSKLQMTSP